MDGQKKEVSENEKIVTEYNKDKMKDADHGDIDQSQKDKNKKEEDRMMDRLEGMFGDDLI